MTTRGLEPAGVDLQARNFRQYISQLNQIDKQQQRIFGTQSRGLNQSFGSAEQSAKKFESQVQRTTSAGQSFNQILSSGILLAFAQQAIRATAEAAQLASNFEAAAVGLNNLAASFGLAGNEIRDAIRSAARGTLSETQIILAANKSLQLEVAKTPEEFARVTRNALVLGKTLGLDATQSIDEFTTALGRKTIRILDNFGIKMEQVNEQVAILGQEKFGVAFEDLTTAQKDLLFIEASLRVADERVQAIGEHAIEAGGSFDRLNAQAENLKLVFGTAILPAASEFADILADAFVSGQQAIAIIAAGAAGVGSILKDVAPAANVGDLFEQFRAGQITFAEFLFGTDQPQEDKTFEQILDDAAAKAEEAFKGVARAQGVAFPEDEIEASTKAIEDNTDALEDNEEQIKALQSAIRQAENLELSFARAAEDAARREARQRDKLNRSQSKDRMELLNDQAKEFDEFQADELKSVKDAQEKLAEARNKAGQEQKREQDKLFRELRQARDRYNLDVFQSQRRFDLQDRRLRAAGDILALQELREDFDLQQKEAKENFDLQQGQRKEDAKDQADTADERRQEQVKQLEQELNEIQNGLDERRDAFLKAQDEEFNNLLAAQAEQQLALEQGLIEQEEDRRISQQRQLEDLGRSLAEQEDITKEGALAIAQQLEEAFGVEGIADTIMSGFTMRQESAFQKLFESIADDIKETEEAIAESNLSSAQAGFGANPSLLLGQQQGTGLHLPIIQKFHQGGIVGGASGSEQLGLLRAGETVLPTHQMNAPIIPSQNLNVNMTGGFDIRGGEAAGQAAVQAALTEMTDAFEVVVRRLGRRI